MAAIRAGDMAAVTRLLEAGVPLVHAHSAADHPLFKVIAAQIMNKPHNYITSWDVVDWLTPMTPEARVAQLPVLNAILAYNEFERDCPDDIGLAVFPELTAALADGRLVLPPFALVAACGRDKHRRPDPARPSREIEVSRAHVDFTAWDAALAASANGPARGEVCSPEILVNADSPARGEVVSLRFEVNDLTRKRRRLEAELTPIVARLTELEAKVKKIKPWDKGPPAEMLRIKVAPAKDQPK